MFARIRQSAGRLEVLGLAGLLVVGCAPTPKRLPSPSPPPETTATGVPIVALAEKLIGTPYRYGGASPSKGFDCSGLVQYVHHQVGFVVPRSTHDQFRRAKPVSLADLQAGDLLFFRLSWRKASHVGIYSGRGRQFIHAPSSGKRVSYSSLDNPYWRRRLRGAGRFY